MRNLKGEKRCRIRGSLVRAYATMKGENNEAQHIPVPLKKSF
jgi:hypothetical protein